MLNKLATLLLLLFAGTAPAFGLTPEDLLPPDQAFRFSAAAKNNNEITLTWKIADSYYLYRNKFHIESDTQEVDLGDPAFPIGKKKHDDLFGEVEIYRGILTIPLPIQQNEAIDQVALKIVYQGCADMGVCYPPQKKTVHVQLSPAHPGTDASQSTVGALNKFTDSLKNMGMAIFQDELLPADDAFRFSATVKDSETLSVSWQIAEGYYLYREKFELSIKRPEAVGIARYSIPRGEPKEDAAFGRVEVFHQHVGFDLPLIRSQTAPVQIELLAKYQGCAERGVCYPPISNSMLLDLPQGNQVTDSKASLAREAPISEQDLIAKTLKSGALWAIVASFFGFGLLLAFTPCVFPMIPILSGIIIGHGDNISTRKAFFLSLTYVLASALTYMAFGVLAGLFGSNLQAAFQEPWVLILFSFLFVLLALSMFGFYTLQMPQALQNRLASWSNRQPKGALLSVAVMGVLSTLIVGPCVAAPLAGALIYIGQTGDAVLGGIALFFLGFGAGFPLLIIGTSAGKLLPKAGPWMNAIKSVFGVSLLAVAIWLLERIFPIWATMLLCAALLIICSVYLGSVTSIAATSSGWQKFFKGAGIIMLTYGLLLLVGVAAGSQSILRPLQGLSLAAETRQNHQVKFKRINNLIELNSQLEQASVNDQWVLLDFYADWCISCKEMEAYTFSDPKVQQALANVVLLQADVTKNSQEDKALLKRFQLIGPPAILFFGLDKLERESYRVIGYQDPSQFLNHLKQVFQ